MKETKLIIAAVMAFHFSIMSILIGLTTYAGTLWQFFPLFPAVYIAGWLWGRG